MVDYYLFGLALALPAIDGLRQWPYCFERSDGFSWKRKMAFDVIIGMDVLLQCDLSLSPSGRCILRFGREVHTKFKPGAESETSC